MLKETSKKYEQTIIMITHNRGIAQTADRVLQVSVFDRIMGNTKYGLIGIQLDSNATEETIAEIRSLENDDIIITDQRESNKQNNAEYSRAMKSHFRKFGNQMSGSGNHLCNYASLLA